ncbi:hypothetical protein [Paraburkholderia sp. CNPSo 3281]|uniref:hypothetical protein n=1 Tax=Paraburkholderia sp. CNPSo 3281 TaxID=2940933 RepID=UPI0020B78C70|nr:hypothetical protein [Paraburkholderia sp. CNPSo 3281]MCP3715102.1 hypothetical protein [Paraburkholderia sp. CNPSo 3281]
MIKQKISFENSQGESLAGLLELPDKPVAYALFAHCFTCGKDLKSASKIARALTEQSIAVLRFDFTGLGNSDGDFSNSNSLIQKCSSLGGDQPELEAHCLPAGGRGSCVAT